MKKSFFSKILTSLLVVVLVLIWVSQPLRIKADQPQMDYVETTLTTQEVKALYGSAAVWIPAALGIIGFIALTYCVLRNVQVPVDFSSSASFNDKCLQLGQYCVDNCTDALKDVLYSAYKYFYDNGITSIFGLSKFLALNIGKFFIAFNMWINSSLISDVSAVGAGLLNVFSNNPFSQLLVMSDSDKEFFINTLTTDYPSRNSDFCIGGNTSYLYIDSLSPDVYIGVDIHNNNTIHFYFYKLTGSTLSHTAFSCYFHNRGSDSVFNQYYYQVYNPGGFLPWVYSSLVALGYPIFFTSDHQYHQDL